MPRIAKDTPWCARRKGSQTFYAFWYDREARETKRLSLGTTDPAEAQNRFALFLGEGEAFTKPNPNGLTVSQALYSYYQEHVLENCVDVRRAEVAMDSLKRHMADTPLCQIDIPTSRSYAVARRKEGVADSTIRRELTCLNAAANHALRWRRISPADMPSVELTKDKVLSTDEEAPFFTKQQISQIFEAADGEFRIFLQLLYWTGARRESIADLERSQVDWPGERIYLLKPGRKVTKKRRPIVPILEPMKAPLQTLWNAEPARPRLFSTTGQAMYKRFLTLAKQLNLSQHKLHCFRHSRATHLLQDGVPLYAVARLLGDTVATVERVYGHHSAETLANQLGGFDGFAL